jgi:hypothetical protein
VWLKRRKEEIVPVKMAEKKTCLIDAGRPFQILPDITKDTETNITNLEQSEN